MATIIPCEEILLRAIRKKDWVDQDTQRVKPEAFLRYPRDRDGLSVNIRSLTADLAGWLGAFRCSYGTDSLHTGRVVAVEEFEFNVIQEDEDDPAHALITGVPSVEDDPAKAERAAGILANMSRVVDRTRRRQQ